MADVDLMQAEIETLKSRAAAKALGLAVSRIESEQHKRKNYLEGRFEELRREAALLEG